MTPKNLEEAVLKVYASVDSKRAREYRKQAGIKGEQMAVVVQEVSDKCDYVCNKAPFGKVFELSIKGS